MISILMNILWLVLGGWSAAGSWFLCAILMVISIVGIPWARAAFNIAILTLWPFGSEIKSRSPGDLGTGPLGFLGNVIWFVLAGFWLMLLHLVLALLLALTVIGIPFALQHLKLARLAMAPIGKRVKF